VKNKKIETKGVFATPARRSRHPWSATTAPENSCWPESGLVGMNTQSVLEVREEREPRERSRKREKAIVEMNKKICLTPLLYY